MNEPTHPPRHEPAIASREEMMSALFANMVMQQINLAMMLLGKVAHPETGQFVQDLDTAQMFIDQLEMLELKTRGNLTKDEAGLLQQGLMSLRMAFVEAIDGGGSVTGDGKSHAQVQPQLETEAAPIEIPAALSAAPEPKPAVPAAAAAPPEESRKKFSKKY